MKESTRKRIAKITNEAVSDLDNGASPDFVVNREILELLILTLERIDELEKKIK